MDRRRLLRTLAVFLALGVVAVAGWFAVNSWNHWAQARLSVRPRVADPDDPLAATPPGPHGVRAVRRDSELSEQMKRANELFAEDKAADAAQILTEAARSNPENEDVHYNLGMALARLGKNDEAILQYQEALRLFPDYAEAHNNLGNLLMRLGRDGEAIQHFEQAIKSMSDYASAHNNLGTALRKAGRMTDAAAQFQEAVKLDPDFWQAHFNLGTSCLQDGRLSAARVEFETVLRLHPDFKPAQVSLAAIQAREAGGAPKP
jgi:Flp pilus assembly protein TadD